MNNLKKYMFLLLIFFVSADAMDKRSALFTGGAALGVLGAYGLGRIVTSDKQEKRAKPQQDELLHERTRHDSSLYREFVRWQKHNEELKQRLDESEKSLNVREQLNTLKREFDQFKADVRSDLTGMQETINQIPAVQNSSRVDKEIALLFHLATQAIWSAEKMNRTCGALMAYLESKDKTMSDELLKHEDARVYNVADFPGTSFSDKSYFPACAARQVLHLRDAQGNIITPLPLQIDGCGGLTIQPSVATSSTLSSSVPSTPQHRRNSTVMPPAHHRTPTAVPGTPKQIKVRTLEKPIPSSQLSVMVGAETTEEKKS